MLICLCKSKIHRATVTEANLNYEGSLTVDIELLDAASILPYEKVSVVNINNGSRIETYTISGKKGSGVICLNGAAARMGEVSDLIIVMSYGYFQREDVPQSFAPIVVQVGVQNQIQQVIRDPMVLA